MEQSELIGLTRRNKIAERLSTIFKHDVENKFKPIANITEADLTNAGFIINKDWYYYKPDDNTQLNFTKPNTESTHQLAHNIFNKIIASKINICHKTMTNLQTQSITNRISIINNYANTVP